MQLEVDTTTRRADGVTFVEVRLRNPGPVARRVRLANRLDGPVLPPRRRGTPEPGWDAEGLTVVVPAGGRRQRGYACPAPPADPPVETVSVDPAADGPDPAAGPAAARRDLRSARPPPDAVAAPVPDGGRGPAPATDPGSASGSGGEPRGPGAAEAYLDTAERRIRRGERLTEPGVATATAALAALGGIGPAAALDDRIDADADRLRRLADRAARLADRAEAADVPVAALRELAGDPADGAAGTDGGEGATSTAAREGEP